MTLTLRNLFRWVMWGCSHAEMIRSRRDDGGLDVVCSRCGYRQPLIRKVVTR